MSAEQLYKIIFMNQGKVYEIYARSVGEGAMYGFIEIEELVFGERSSVVVDPAEEKIKMEFDSVKRTYIPMHAIIRIDEVEKQGVSKISSFDGSNIAAFPMAGFSPDTGESGK